MADVKVNIIAEDNFSSTLGNFGNIMTGIKSVIDMVGDTFRLFKDYALEGLDAIASYERLTATLETLSARELMNADSSLSMAEALAQSSEKATELLDWMQQLAIKSPFTLEGVANAFRTAQAYGFTADEAQRLTQAMIDFAAGSGASEGVMNQIALALGQIEAKGKLAGQEVLQLVNAGLPVTQILADAFNVTTAEIVDMQQKGLIPAQDAIEAITVYLETNFAGAAERQANTWAGLQGTFEDIKQMGLREFFGGLFDVIQPLAIELSEFMQTEGLDQLRVMGEQLGQAAQSLLDFGQQLQGMSFVDITQMFQDWAASVDWNQISNDFADAIDSIDWAVVGDKIYTGVANILEGVGDIISRIDWGRLLRSFGNAFADLFAGLAGYISWEDLVNQWGTVISFYFKQIGNSIVDGIKQGLIQAGMSLLLPLEILAMNMINFFKHLLGISSPSTVFMEIGANIVNGLKTGLMIAWTGLVTLVETLIGFLLAPFQPILDLLGIDISGLTSGGPTAPVNVGTTGTLTTGTNNYYNYYYGPVYFNDTGQTNGGVDCQYPNPLLSASAFGGVAATPG